MTDPGFSYFVVDGPPWAPTEPGRAFPTACEAHRHTEGLPALPDGQVYRVWAARAVVFSDPELVTGCDRRDCQLRHDG